ncbi:LLM class flavin-dependent oxidoreductase [Rhizobium sp. CF142]|uniref:LLM class flavin-dependent oxidoreductase n=1 Tax=Rhizobium sp. CF142 TaxID=1144314 RepID=UPI00026EEC32|nr:LLM class flavin-dependent oxidoreductase [Rhizobium sp. CF142]EJJ26717.1 FMN-dependent oxidoreductase, nitrilotriacetate monooxygenase family [Rhizobium sp. CF142]
MHLAAFVSAGPTSGSHAGWRYPGAETDFTSLAHYQRLGSLLEEGRFDMIFFADILSVPDRLAGTMDSQLRYGGLGALRLDPMIVLAALAGSTKHVGLAATISTSYAEPYSLARAVATLDHMSGGRAAWNIVTSFQEAEAKNFSQSKLVDRSLRYERGDEFLEVVTKLWNSWESGALVQDAAAPLFADPSKVHQIDHKGQWFDVRGPLNVSRTPQGRPVLLQAGASDLGKDFAAKWADVVFVKHSAPEAAAAYRSDLRERAARAGRNPDDIRVLPGIVPIIAETRAMAEESRALLESLVEPDAGLSTLSYHIDIDLSQFPQHEVLPAMDVPGAQGDYREVAELTRRSGISLRELGRRYGVGTSTTVISGTAKDVADMMEEWTAMGACDGFMIMPPVVPHSLENFVRLVIPELQRRGLFRKEYGGKTLRENMGLSTKV